MCSNTLSCYVGENMNLMKNHAENAAAVLQYPMVHVIFIQGN